MHGLYSTAEIRQIERVASAALGAGELMRRAGQAAAQAAQKLFQTSIGAARILILAGPGNNGGDAFEAAVHLANAGAQVWIAELAENSPRSREAQQAKSRAARSFATWIQLDQNVFSTLSEPWTLVIDGLFGIGLTRPIESPFAEVISAVNQLRCPVLALDISSGLQADTGAGFGANNVMIRASHTVTFIADKPGLHTAFGRDAAGQVQLATLDVNAEYFPVTRLQLNQPALFAEHLKPRPHNSHKGSFGDVAIIGGAAGMRGAALLAARAALHSGAGRVLVGLLDATFDYDSSQPELIVRDAIAGDLNAAAIVIGPGLGQSAIGYDLLARVLALNRPLVLDADALNLLSADVDLQQQCRQRDAMTLMTPHPLEAARLLQTGSAEIQADRLTAARMLAQRYGAIVVLKGSGTVIAAPSGQVVINPTGNPALATGGTGDVLAGLCGALLAQGWPVWETALGAVWLHGAAADWLVEQGVGPIGLTAGELVLAIRKVLNRMIQEKTAE